MAEAVTERVRRYILDGTDQDLRRLLSIAELSAEMARSAFGRLGVRQGWNAIDCGCGPIGGLAVMAEMVGPAGRVVGIDFSRGWPAECAAAPLQPSMALRVVSPAHRDQACGAISRPTVRADRN